MSASATARAGAVALTVAVLAAWLPGGTAAAQATTDPELQLVSQRLVIAPDQPLTAVLAVAGQPPEGTTLAVTVSSRLRAPRQDLEALLGARAADGTGTSGSDGNGARDTGGTDSALGSTVDFLSIPLAEVPRDAGGRLNIALPTVRNSGDDNRDALRLTAPGLYPVTFELRTADEDLVSSLLTFVQRTDDTVPVVPMAVALVTSIESPPAGQPAGGLQVSEQARTDLQQLTQALRHNPAVPATVSLPPELLDALSASASPQDQQLVQDLGAALAGRQVLSRPYVSMQPSASAGSGLADDYARLLAQGEDTLRRLYPGVVPDRTAALVPGTLDDDGLQLLRNLGTLNVVLGPARTAKDQADPGAQSEGDQDGDNEDPRTGADPTKTVQVLGLDGSLVRATVLDEDLRRRTMVGDDPVLAAHYTAVELIALEAEGAGQPGRGVVVLPPDGASVNDVFLGTLEDQLTQIPQVRPVTLGGVFAATAAATGADTMPVTIPAPGGEVEDLRRLAEEVDQRRAAVRHVGSMLPARDPLPAEMRQRLDLSLADDLDDAQRTTYLADVDGRLEQVTASVVPMDRRQFTITSRDTTIPITVRTTWPEPLKVKIRLTSPKLDFPEGDQIITIDESTPPFRVPIVAKSNGTFPVTALILTPDGDDPLGTPMSLTVRSTALSGLGILATIAAVLALGAWWFQHLRSKRRARAVAASAERHPTAPIERDGLSLS